jgi:hypothetical protein
VREQKLGVGALSNGDACILSDTVHATEQADAQVSRHVLLAPKTRIAKKALIRLEWPQ